MENVPSTLSLFFFLRFFSASSASSAVRAA
jgi:hypothetical protein